MDFYFDSPYISGLFIITVLLIIAWWRIFEKAGEAGWKALIPLYNTYILYKISMGSGWYFILLMIPFVNIAVYILMCMGLARSFGKGIGFTLGLIFLSNIFMLILGYGSSEYLNS
ncbi:DUF5684 domain-containing protein [Anaerofustis stercorihominis]|nr:DUF5684 domain-containing protein [Anaerofustis stercorihominis]MCQ4794473.1 DUF5684 domain-containing protein [Anaerofustis stercorihominis]